MPQSAGLWVLLLVSVMPFLECTDSLVGQSTKTSGSTCGFDYEVCGPQLFTTTSKSEVLLYYNLYVDTSSFSNGDYSGAAVRGAGDCAQACAEVYCVEYTLDGKGGCYIKYTEGYGNSLSEQTNMKSYRQCYPSDVDDICASETYRNSINCGCQEAVPTTSAPTTTTPAPTTTTPAPTTTTPAPTTTAPTTTNTSDSTCGFDYEECGPLNLNIETQSGMLFFYNKYDFTESSLIDFQLTSGAGAEECAKQCAEYTVVDSAFPHCVEYLINEKGSCNIKYTEGYEQRLTEQFNVEFYRQCYPSGLDDICASEVYQNSRNCRCPASKPSTTAAPTTAAPTTAGVFEVTLAVSLPMTMADFERKKNDFRAGIAAAAVVSAADVRIVSVSVASMQGRRLLKAIIRVEIAVTAADAKKAKIISAGLTADRITSKLSESGITEVNILELPVKSNNVPMPKSINVAANIAAANTKSAGTHYHTRHKTTTYAALLSIGVLLLAVSVGKILNPPKGAAAYNPITCV